MASSNKLDDLEYGGTLSKSVSQIQDSFDEDEKEQEAQELTDLKTRIAIVKQKMTHSEDEHDKTKQKYQQVMSRKQILNEYDIYELDSFHKNL